VIIMRLAVLVLSILTSLPVEAVAKCHIGCRWHLFIEHQRELSEAAEEAAAEAARHARLDAEFEARDRLWREECKPTRKTGAEGMSHFEYAKADCGMKVLN
jgi:hypothetical protein